MPELNASSSRLISIDRFRGMIVFCMIFFIGAAEFPCLGILSRIANNSKAGRIMLFDGMSLADLADPIFLFLISLSYQHSFDKRYSALGNRAYLHFLGRYFIFMGIGSIMVSAEYLLVGNGRDPYIYLTVLMFAAALLFLASCVMRLLKRIPDGIKKYTRIALNAVLIALGLSGLVLGIRDDAIIFFGIKNAELFKHWSILHEIGLTGLLVLPFIRLNIKGKLLTWFTVGTVYTLIQTLPDMIRKFDIVVLGGAVGTVGWFLLMFGGVIMMELYNAGKHHMPYFIALGILGIFSFFLCAFLPMNTSAVTVNYVVFSLFVSAVLFFFFDLTKNVTPKFQLFVWWGRNPLPLFLIGLILRAIQKMWNPSPDTGVLVAAAATFGSIAALSVLAYYMYKKDVVIKL